ncbi:hypothetical protein [Klebsiella aerogenes]|uniref:hypothetical protein n=1 Tax=Klebsiella aerogenes TaxID=548 RepID=UPI001BD67092|nr:hypothetical protein [Klebsiella aerogenes]
MIFKKDTLILSSPSPYHDELNTHIELSSEQHLALLAEQALIERMSCLQEIEDLRLLLQNNHIYSNHITGWIERSDNVLDKLLRYRLGKCGQLVNEKKLIMPYSWRRKFRKRYA